MKIKHTLPLLVGLSFITATAIAATPATGAFNTAPTSEQEKISYTIGVDLGKKFKRQSIDVNPDFFLNGFTDGMSGKKTVLSKEEMESTLQAFRSTLADKHAKDFKQLAEQNFKSGEQFLLSNKAKPGVISLASGLQYKVITEGKGQSPAGHDIVTTHYRGTFIDGSEFDSSYRRGSPAQFPVDGVISGWSEALQLMKPGAHWQVFVPANLAYGTQGAGDRIGPNQTLVFDIELISVQNSNELTNKPQAATK